VLQSRAGVLESVGKEDSVVARDQAAKIMATLSAFPGRRSERFEKLLKQLQGVASAGAADSTPCPFLIFASGHRL
jgi:hypothetical protein